MRPSQRARRGFALLATLAAIVLGSMLLVAAITLQQAEREAVSLDGLRLEAFAAASSAVVRTAASLSAAAARNARVGLPIRYRYSEGETVARVAVRKLDSTLVWVTAIATATRGDRLSRHRIGALYVIPRDTTVIALQRLPEHGWVELF